MRKRLISLLAALVVPLAFATPTYAATGDLLRTITVTPAPACDGSPITVGIAFDGTELMVSCIYNKVVTRVDPSNGMSLGSYTITGMLPADGGIGAMSWDGDANQLWIASSQASPQHVYRVKLDKTLGTGIATLAFSHLAGGLALVDGLAYDGTDKSIWFSPDVSNTIWHYDQAGTVLGTKSGLCAALGGSCNSGVAIADANTIYLANDGGKQVYSWNKSFSGSPSLFIQAQARLEGLACDGATFAKQNVAALWTKDAFDWDLRAYEVPAGQCAQGGVVQSKPTTVTLDPLAATDPVNTDHTVTATVRDQFGNPMGGITVFFTVTRTPPVAVTNTGSCVTALPSGSCSFTYHGPILPATDAITGCANSPQGPPCGAASKTWVLPVSNPLCTIDITNGGWMVADNGDKVNFGGTVHTDQAGAPSGQEQYTDKPVNLDVHSIDIKAVTCSSNLETADIFGEATINGSGTFVFRIEVSDPDSSSAADTYWITLSNGYDSGKHDLGGGTIEIHNT